LAEANWFFSSSSSTMRPCSKSMRNILPGCSRHFLTMRFSGIGSTPDSDAITTRPSSVTM
jgi:hypothetical protein